MSWTIADIPVAFVADSTPPTLTRGTEVTLPLTFAGADEDAVEPTDSRYPKQYPFNYNTPSTEPPYRRHYNDLLDYLAYQGDAIVRRGTTDRGVPWFRERLPEDAPVETLVVALDVGETYPERRSHWGIIIGGRDRSTLPTTFRRVDIDVFVLAPLDEYADRDAVADAFEDELTV